MKNINEIIKKLLGTAIENDLTHTSTRLFSESRDYDIFVEITINKSFRPLSVMDTLKDLNIPVPLDTQEGIKE